MSQFDTDVLVWLQRNNPRAIRIVDSTFTRFISVQTYMELLQTAQNKTQLKWVKDFLSEYEFEILPLTQNIGHRAAIYVENYTLSSGMYLGDAIIAATAVENNLALISGNKKHFKNIPSLQLKVFKP